MNGEIRSPPKEEELKLKGFAYLLKLEADQNHNRYYRMVQEGDRFKIEMGRIGARPVCMVRPMTLWDTTYQKKIKEGYEDRSEFCDVSVEKNQNYKLMGYILHHGQKNQLITLISQDQSGPRGKNTGLILLYTKQLTIMRKISIHGLLP